jgi:hypothetical protein
MAVGVAAGFILSLPTDALEDLSTMVQMHLRTRPQRQE